MNDHTTGPNLISIAAEIEEHAFIASIAFLHVALGNSTMEETVQVADAMRLAYRMDEHDDQSCPARGPVSFADALKVLRALEADLDHYGELTVATVTEFRAVLAKLDGETAPAGDRPF